MKKVWTSNKLDNLLKIDYVRNSLVAKLDVLSRRPKAKTGFSKLIIGKLDELKENVIKVEAFIRNKS